MRKWLDNSFGITKSGSDFKSEFFAGITTFMTMSYIIFVNPMIMAKAGMPTGAVMVATCLASGIATILMGIIARYPIGLAPSMGTNAFVTFGIVIGMGFSWQAAMAAIFIEGILFIILTVLKIRDQIMNCIPLSLKIGISAGIGLFLMIIGFQNSGIVVANESTLVTLGDIKNIKVILSFLGLILIVVLHIFKIKGSILISIIAITGLAVILGLEPMPNGIVAVPPSIEPIFMKMDFSAIFTLNFIIIVFLLLFLDIFNTVGTLIGVATQAGLIDKNGNLERAKSAFMADAVGTTIGAALGVTTVTAYVESVTGVEAGGRTGFVAIIIGVLFLLAIFFSPIVQIVPPYATAPALIFVGALMVSIVKVFDTSDWTEYFPALITMVLMPFTYNIVTGIEFGMIIYVLIKLFTGRIKEVSFVMIILSLLFIIKDALV